MADDKSNRGPQDGTRISLNEDYDVAYWTKRFGVTEEQLAQAVKAVGHSVAEVEKYLGTLERANDSSVKAASKIPSP